MSARALKYAEETLGVHEVFEETVEEVTKIDNLLSELDKARDRKRQLEDDIADREVELIGEMRGVHYDMAVTRFESELKGWKRSDQRLGELRGQLNEVLADIQGVEFDLDISRLKVKTGCARMEELGGYLHYLAAVKQAETAVKTTKKTPDTKE